MDNLWIWLVVSTYPSEKYDFVNWDDDIPNTWKNKTCSKPPTRRYIMNIYVGDGWIIERYKKSENHQSFLLPQFENHLHFWIRRSDDVPLWLCPGLVNDAQLAYDLFGTQFNDLGSWGSCWQCWHGWSILKKWLVEIAMGFCMWSIQNTSRL